MLFSSFMLNILFTKIILKISNLQQKKFLLNKNFNLKNQILLKFLSIYSLSTYKGYKIVIKTLRIILIRGFLRFEMQITSLKSPKCWNYLCFLIKIWLNVGIGKHEIFILVIEDPLWNLNRIMNNRHSAKINIIFFNAV